jgi:hypothetical protein
MFGRLKNLFRKRADEEQVVEPPAETFAPREFRPGYAPGGPVPPPPAPVEEEPSPPEEPVEAPTAASATGDFVQLPLRAILLKLPDLLKNRVRQPPATNVQVSIPIQKILPQLAHGSVKIAFSELRQAAPAGVFLDSSDQDQTLIELPLPAVLAQLKPSQLPRRGDQRKVEVPEEVSSLFGSRGEPLTTVRMSTASAPASAAPPSKPAVAPTPGHAPAFALKPPSAPPPAAPIRPTSPLPEAPAKPAVPIRPTTPLTQAPIKPSAPLPSPASLKPQVPPAPTAPPPTPTPTQPIRPSQPLPLPATPSRQVAPAAPIAAHAAPVQPSVPGEPLSVPLASVIFPRFNACSTSSAGKATVASDAAPNSCRIASGQTLITEANGTDNGSPGTLG